MGWFSITCVYLYVLLLLCLSEIDTSWRIDGFKVVMMMMESELLQSFCPEILKYYFSTVCLPVIIFCSSAFFFYFQWNILRSKVTSVSRGSCEWTTCKIYPKIKPKNRTFELVSFSAGVSSLPVCEFNGCRPLIGWCSQHLWASARGELTPCSLSHAKGKARGSHAQFYVCSYS